MYFSTTYSSPLGLITMASDGHMLSGLWFEGQKYFGGTIHAEMTENMNLSIFNKTKIWLEKYFDGKKPPVSDLPLAPNGGDFRKLVWNILCDIPYGEYISYGQIAKILASKINKASMSSQAIGGAVGHNPISIIIPCHRVVGASGSLTGYAGGLDRKYKLLQHEGVDMTKLSIPRKGTAL